MAKEKLRQLWKNEYFNMALTIVLLIAIVIGFWYGSQIIFNTGNPYLAVASGSMLPTLNIGDLIIVQSIDPAQINASKLTGDILVFRDPRNPESLIVHRAVKIENYSSYYMITTLGDADIYGEKDMFSPWNSSLLIGKVVARIPYIGNLPLFLHSGINLYIFIIIIIIILIITILPFGSSGEEKSEKEGQHVKENKLPFNIDLNLILFILLNILIIGFLIFSLWGSFTFWQPGADPQRATIRGMLSDLQFHETYTNEAYLSQGLLSYNINWKVNDEIRLGVPTFSWFQFSLLILVLFNGWKLFQFYENMDSKNKQKRLIKAYEA